jgi:hypothetical protein
MAGDSVQRAGEARQRAENLDQIVEAGQVCEGGQRQESLYNEQEKPDSKQRN